MKIIKLRIRFWSWRVRLFGDLHEWIARHAPLIPVAKPKPPLGAFCPDCRHLLTKICAVDTGDGWAFFWECEDNCGAADCFVDDSWYPFRFGAYCNSKDLAAIGIEVV